MTSLTVVPYRVRNVACGGDEGLVKRGSARPLRHSRMVGLVVSMAVGHIDATANPKPGTRGYLKWYWTKGPGLVKWIDHPHPWTALYHHLVKHMPIIEAKRTASQWFHDTTGMWPAERKGKNPLGRG